MHSDYEPAWERLDKAQALRLALLASGYVPIPLIGKRPANTAWQSDVAPNIAEVTSWKTLCPAAFNTGILTKRAPAIDIDVTDGVVANAIADRAAELVDESAPLPVRFGRHPKRAILCRTDEPFDKIRTPDFTSPDGATHHVEILCDGQQLAAFGRHPDTGREYEWPHGAPGNIKHSELPLLTPAAAKRFIDDATTIMRRAGWQERKPKRAAGNGANGPAAAAVEAGHRERQYANAALHGCCAELAASAPGGRNDALNKAAFRLATMVGSGWIDQQVVEQRLYDAAVQNGSVEDDGSDAALATIKSGIEAGLNEPPPDLAPHQAAARDRNADLADDPDLAAMNAKYAVVRVGGKTRVVTLEESPVYPGSMVPVFSTIPDFCAFHAKRKKEIVGPGGAVKRIGIGRWWIDHEERRQYDAIVYAPNVSDDNKLNLWTGFGCKPQPGDCGLYLAHLHDIICAGHSDHSQYLLGWMAYAVRHAGRQGEVAVVLRGKEGVGKGVFAKQFGRLFGSHFKHITNAKHLVGHFNAHLQHCSVLFADEAFFAGDRSHESVLKGLITEETILVEPKGVDPYSVRNCIHLIMSSNSDWVVPAGADARRYFVLDVSDTHMQDSNYFAAIARQMDDGGLAALLHYLLNLDISDLDVRSVPKTAALADQKTRSRRGVDRLVEGLAYNGTLPYTDATSPNVAITTGEEKGEGFYVAARHMVPDLRHENSIVIARTLTEHWGCSNWHSGYRRGIKFPPLLELRAKFDRRHGPQQWPPIQTWGSAP